MFNNTKIQVFMILSQYQKRWGERRDSRNNDREDKSIEKREIEKKERKVNMKNFNSQFFFQWNLKLYNFM